MKHCRICPAEITNNRTYCPECAERLRLERKRAFDMKAYRAKSKDNLKIIRVLLHDPSPEPLTVGMTISAEQHDWMMKLGTYTPGTVIRQGDERRRIDLVQGKMVEVRI